MPYLLYGAKSDEIISDEEIVDTDDEQENDHDTQNSGLETPMNSQASMTPAKRRLDMTDIGDTQESEINVLAKKAHTMSVGLVDYESDSE